MTIAEKHIRHYNNLNGKEISKETLSRFHHALKKDIDSKRIDAHVNYGVECISMEKRIAKALKEMNGANRIVHCSKVINLGKPNLLITQTARGPEVVRARKAIHYHHEDLTYLYGLPCIQDDKDLGAKSLGIIDGVNEDVYKVITDRILKLIEAGGLLWRKPWNTQVNSPADLAHNGVTKFAYRGVNYILNFLSEALGGLSILDKNGKEKIVKYKHMDFYTFKQVKTLKGFVKAGESGWPVTYFKWLYKQEGTGALVPKEVAVQGGVLLPGFTRIPGLFYYTVFNYEQCDGFESSFVRSKPRTEIEKIESAERIVEKFSAMPGAPLIKVVTGSDKAFYSITKDDITVPSINQFKAPQQYYSVLFHEMVHSTGAESRLKRELTGAGSGSKKAYAFEELIAEMGACFLCGESGILYYTMKNSAAYVETWSKALVKEMKEDPKFFLKACSAAQRATDFILGRVYESQEDKDKKPAEKKEDKSTPGKQKDRKPVAKKKRAESKKIKTFVPKSRGGKKTYAQRLDTAIKKARQLAMRGGMPSDSSLSKMLDEFSVDRDKLLKAYKEGLDTPESKKAFEDIEMKHEKSRKPVVAGLGFITADKTPEEKSDTFTLPGPVGSLLGTMQRYKLEIVIAGETHSGKSELGKQLADAFLSAGYSVGWVDWEQGGLQSRDTKESIERNVSSENRKKLMVSADVPKTLDAVKSLAGKFDVICLDSGSSLKQVTNEWIDQLREEYPDTIWIILMQQNTKGGTRGGAAAEFDSPVVLKTYRPDHSDFKKNYAYVFKNRGNPQTTGKHYLIADKKMTDKQPGVETKSIAA